MKSIAEQPSSEAVAWALRDRSDLTWLDDPSGHDILVWGASEKLHPGPDFHKDARALLRAEAPVAGLPFCGGLAGFLGYEAGRWLESMPEPQPRLLPELVLRRYDGALIRRPGGAWVAAGSRNFVAEAVHIARSATEAPPVPMPSASESPLEGAPFLHAVEHALKAIERGDYYQVNLSRRLEFTGVDEPLQVYRRLRRAEARYGAFVSVPGGALLSNSPELFLELRDGRVCSRPIKGTRPLGQEHALESDPKERAELTMIVDLVRNDLGRVCSPGSIRTQDRRVYALPTLLHAEQAVHGVLAPGHDALDLHAASFPPGSVTGAPKVMAMRAIAALEPVPRGAYTGCVGYLADGGDACLSVAIRTATVLGTRAWAHVGCGIVADSVPERELHESEVKATALRRALVGM